MTENQQAVMAEGSIRQILSDNIGKNVKCEFLIGAQLQERSGIVYSVSDSILVLHNVTAGEYMVCDIFSVRFITFYDPGFSQTPMPISSASDTLAIQPPSAGDAPALPAAPSASSAPDTSRARSQAALNYIKRKSGI